jgi:antitoxin CptB
VLVDGRLRWRCRRGVKELDVLLTRFLDDGYSQLNAQERGDFESLLDLPDPELAAYCLGQLPAPATYSSLIQRLAQFKA